MDTSAHASDSRLPSPAVAEAVVEGLLSAHRAGALDEWLRRHRRVARWLTTHWLDPMMRTAGDRLDSAKPSAATALLLRWAVGRQRPDLAPLDAAIAREAWLDRTSWRPVLALACQFGFLAAPSFRDRYHGHADEPVVSQLCGLWSVGGSTCYRYLDKGRRALAQCLRSVPPSAEQRLALREATLQAVWPDEGAPLADDARRAWHVRQASAAQIEGDSVSALWHLARAGDTAGVIRSLQRHSVELANEAETDAIVDRVADRAETPREHVELLLARAALARMRGDAGRELAHDEQALRHAAEADDALLLGMVYGALGKFHEPRDLDRAFACYQDSVDCLRRCGLGEASDAALEVIEEYVSTLTRLAWLYALRNDPRARALLERAQTLSGRYALMPATLAMLEQTWGECLRRSGDLPGSIERKHRALLLYERIDDRQAILKTCGNLSLIYGEAKDFAKACDYAHRVLALAATMSVEPEILASTHVNLGVAHFWQSDYAQARAEYEAALDIAMHHRLHNIAGRAHYNLAEVAYLQFKQSGDTADERRGTRMPPPPSRSGHTRATRRIRRPRTASSATSSAPPTTGRATACCPPKPQPTMSRSRTCNVSASASHCRVHRRSTCARIWRSHAPTSPSR